jgi:glycosyltransferase involved in cell wall biosynthesis
MREAVEPAPVLSVVVPAWNEAENLPVCLRGLRETLGMTPAEILVVDDGSSDWTLAVAKRLAAEWPDGVRIVSHERNLGLGAALLTGFRESRGTYVMCCPADFLMTPDDWRPFASALGQADVLVGCRIRREGYNALMRFNAWLYPRLVNGLFGLRLKDVNWICLYRRDLVARVVITQRGIPMLTELLVRLRDLGASFHEVDCRMQPRRIGTPSAARVSVMWRTLRGLGELWWSYRRASTTRRPRVEHEKRSGTRA